MTQIYNGVLVQLGRAPRVSTETAVLTAWVRIVSFIQRAQVDLCFLLGYFRLHLRRSNTITSYSIKLVKVPRWSLSQYLAACRSGSVCAVWKEILLDLRVRPSFYWEESLFPAASFSSLPLWERLLLHRAAGVNMALEDLRSPDYQHSSPHWWRLVKELRSLAGCLTIVVKGSLYFMSLGRVTN
jgi:hypothetical protein